jgi:glycine cleavage system aminomethyltransferase T
MKTTVLHDVHSELGARLVEFGGWHMPVHTWGACA